MRYLFRVNEPFDKTLNRIFHHHQNPPLAGGQGGLTPVDDGRSVYNVEMQTTTDRALAQRSRFYQSHIDMSMLRRGRPYDKLGECYVIFICKFDPFGRGLSRYSFRYRCDGRRHSLTLNDGAYRLFFNTTGTILNIPPKLRELLKYMNDTRAYDVARSDSELIHRIDRAVTTTKHSQKWRQDYMIYQVKEREAELRGEERKQYELARKMILKSMPNDLIVELSDLSLSEVQALRSKLQK